jgi:hypothetical protein
MKDNEWLRLDNDEPLFVMNPPSPPSKRAKKKFDFSPPSPPKPPPPPPAPAPACERATPEPGAAAEGV